MVAAIPQTALLAAVLLALASSGIGPFMARRNVVFGRMLTTFGIAALAAILLTVVLQLSRLEPRFDLDVPDMGMPAQVVEGGETRIPMAPDGHFWLRATVNGAPVDFMVDTGATLTAVSDNAARRAGLQARRGGLPISLNTANGVIAAQLTSIKDLRFGNVAARDLDAVMAENFGETNVIGMNLLARLKSWRVEGGTLVMVPRQPQQAIGQ